MTDTTSSHDVTLWLVDDIPARMFYAGRRWTVSDTPTRLRDSVWSLDVADDRRRGLYGWRFQGTDPEGCSFVFDVYCGEAGWHVHRAYA
ncbi:hypothetical protein [Microbacterium imperiale]|uniref:Uncharacterized protein n=1 Tax=Microbacterium imperiale TaxID=33884 RepID=A0A9W6M3N5_9MICO|nr:hypothetical protein [Microbacterium imperiale]MBP2420516.1 hypothetical protein [Microbacterium imperiale]MDS0200538.1 hypothetical protein [Microbacterium imperiale]BFE40857.1 hypothetical protein GCM10017544_18130 [Microbacterium imperiale]GLJ79967.1 hypothetical protein GCM10017586_16500 [Microbacterium imperiale]